MNQNNLFERTGYIIALVTLFFSWILFYSENGILIDSFFAALMAAGLFWMTYVIVRLVWLAFKKN